MRGVEFVHGKKRATCLRTPFLITDNIAHRWARRDYGRREVRSLLRVARRWCRVSNGLVGPVQRAVARVGFLAFVDVAHREHACAPARGELDEPRVAGVAAVVDVSREDSRASMWHVSPSPAHKVREVRKHRGLDERELRAGVLAHYCARGDVGGGEEPETRAVNPRWAHLERRCRSHDGGAVR